MKIENEKIHLATLSIPQIRINGVIFGMEQGHQLPLSGNQVEILQLMSEGHSISQIVKTFLEKNILLSFEQLKDLLRFLVNENLLLNENFKSYFKTEAHEPKGILENLSHKIFGDKEAPFQLDREFKNIPFLRGIDPKIISLLLQNSKLIESPSGIAVCQVGQSQRSLFVMLKGEASVYKHHGHNKRKVAVVTENAVFGEVGFFFGEPRTADVITDTECLILRIKYVPEIYDSIIKVDKARHLQKRIWLIHALLKSEIFRDIPQDCFDALIFSGELRSFAPQSLICAEGDFGNTCYIVVQGNLVVSQHGRSIRVLGQGDVFGEVALIMTGGKRSASVQAQTEVLALEIPSQKFYDLLGQNLMLACEFEKVALTRIHLDQASKK